MKGMVVEDQPCALRIGKTVLRERQIAVFVMAVKFIADNGMAKVGKVDAELMFAAGVRDYP